MSREIRRKAIGMFVVEILFLVLLGALLFTMQTNLSLKNQRESSHEKLKEIDSILEQGAQDEVSTTQSFDEIYQAKAGSMAFMFQNGVLDGYNEENMRECRKLLDADNALVLDREGNILAQAQKEDVDFTHVRFNQLRTVFENDGASTAFDVTAKDKTYRYYGYKIDEESMAVLTKEPEELNELLAATSTWEAMLKPVKVGLNGFTFAVSNKDYTFLYYPNEDLVDMDALSEGIDVEDLEDDHYTWLTIHGEKLYCGVEETEDAYVICAVPEDEIISSRNVTVLIILFSVFVVMTLVIVYALFMMAQEEKEGRKPLKGNFFYNSQIGKKIGMVSVIGLVCILLVSFYMQTLFSLSQQSLSNNQRVAEIENDIKNYEGKVESVTEQYNERYLNKAQIAAYMLTVRPEFANRDTLEELSGILGVEAISLFDKNGVQTATNSVFTRVSISDDPEDQSYEFQKLLLGKEYLIQDAQVDELTGEYLQYIGVTLRDEEGNADGFVRICMAPEQLQKVIDSMRLENVLKGIKVGNDGVVFAIDKDSEKFVYYPNEKVIGRKASAYGLGKAQLVDEYAGYLTLGDSKYFASSLEVGNNYIYAAVPSGSVGGNRLPLTIVTGISSAVALLIIFLLLTVTRKAPETEKAENQKPGKDRVNVDVVMPDKKIKKTMSASSRWGIQLIAWRDKTPEQQLFTVLKGMLGFFAVIIGIVVLMNDTLFDENSIFHYILSGDWSKGFNIFAVTASLMILCLIEVATMIAQQLLAAMARTFGAKGETICRLLSNFVKYFSVIGFLYYCLALFGIDTATLLASAGILTLVVGLGAQTLVSDILAGLFIIFEGEFQVGDIVTIGDYRGTVVEIGIRTTKIEDGSKNIKIISNSDVTGVINMTRDYSYSWVDVGIEYGESLERVESILQDEFPKMREQIPGILDGPFYKGVVSLGDNSVNIRVMVLCAESDRARMECDLNRAMKLIFDKYHISIPFPQIVINQPTEFKEATAWEKRKAEEFAKAQRELTQDYVEEDEENH